MPPRLWTVDGPYTENIFGRNGGGIRDRRNENILDMLRNPTPPRRPALNTIPDLFRGRQRVINDWRRYGLYEGLNLGLKRLERMGQNKGGMPDYSSPREGAPETKKLWEIPLKLEKTIDF